MNEWQKEILQAEITVQKLAEELAKAKGLTESVAVLQRRLNEVISILEEAQGAMQGTSAQAQSAIRSAIEALRQASEQLNQSVQGLSLEVRQAISDFGEQVSQSLQQAYQALQEHLVATLREASKFLLNAANQLTELHTGFNQCIKILTQQNEQLLSQIATQDEKIKWLLRLLIFCLLFISLTTVASFVTIALLLRH